jgi:hypothetical protein
MFLATTYVPPIYTYVFLTKMVERKEDKSKVHKLALRGPLPLFAADCNADKLGSSKTVAEFVRAPDNRWDAC